MGVLTLDQIKTHLKIELDDDTRDAELEDLLNEATDIAAQFIDRPIPWTDDLGAEVAVPAGILSAIKLIIGGLDQQRESAVVGAAYNVTGDVERILWPHRVMSS